MTNWADRGNKDGSTGALHARLNNTTATYGNIRYDYSESKGYKNIKEP